MKVTISHNKPKAEVIKAADRSIEEVFKGLNMGPVEIIDPKKSWSGSTMNFSLKAKMGFLNAPIVGTVVVTDKDVTVDADLGILEKLLTPSAKASLETSVRGLLT